MGEARNLAAKKTQGSWLAFLDCDDVWFPSKLASQVEIARTENEDLGLIYARTIYLSKDRRNGEEVFSRFESIPLPEGQILRQLLLQGDFIPLVSALVRKSAFEDVGGIPPHFEYAEDYYLFVALSEKYRIRAVQQNCCYYRVHEDNFTKKAKRAVYLEPLEIIDNWQHYLSPKEFSRRRAAISTGLAIFDFLHGTPSVKGLISLIRTVSIPFLLYRLSSRLGKPLVLAWRRRLLHAEKCGL